MCRKVSLSIPVWQEKHSWTQDSASIVLLLFTCSQLQQLLLLVILVTKMVNALEEIELAPKQGIGDHPVLHKTSYCVSISMRV